jgi:hypothetical protein
MRAAMWSKSCARSAISSRRPPSPGATRCANGLRGLAQLLDRPQQVARKPVAQEPAQERGHQQRQREHARPAEHAPQAHALEVRHEHEAAPVGHADGHGLAHHHVAHLAHVIALAALAERELGRQRPAEQVAVLLVEQVVGRRFAAVELREPALEPGDTFAAGDAAGLADQRHVPLVRVFISGAGARLLQVI